MSIKSTKHIARQVAIDRIKLIQQLVIDKDYQELEQKVFEPDYTVQQFIDKHELTDIFDIDKWTNKMLEDLMDEPFYRESMFDNYLIEDS